MKNDRSARRPDLLSGASAGVISVALLIAAASDVAAAPDPCTTTSGAAVCSGDQSAGINLSDVPPAVFLGGLPTSLTVRDLTGPVAPAAGLAGIAYRQDLRAVTGAAGAAGAGTANLSAIVGGGVTMQASGGLVSGLDVGAFAAHGVNGGVGQAGGAGGAAGALLVTNGGTIALTGTRAPASRAVEFGRQAELAQANLGIQVIDLALAFIDGADTSLLAQAAHIQMSLVFFGLTDEVLAEEIRTVRSELLALKAYLEEVAPPDETRQHIAGAVSARSVGGAGGVGGSVFIGPPAGPGGAGGAGGAVLVENTGALTTNGVLTAGVLALSAGGAGGNSGVPPIGLSTPPIPGAGGAGGAVRVVNSGAITTGGFAAPGIFAQSSGGDGGSPGSANSVNGANGGAGGAVSVDHDGTISTGGGGAYGLFARSLGGTGGEDFSGGIGGTGGAAGAVTVTLGGAIATAGDAAHGLYAASQGGAGAAGADGGGTGGDGGAAGAVRVTAASTAVVTTLGADAHAFYARSRGGNGGVGDSVNVFWGSAGGGGNGGAGGDVFAINAGSLSTQGDFAYGLFAQSLSGAGGVGGDAAGFVAISGVGGGGAPAGNVEATNSGRIVTSGVGAHAFFGQSVAGAGGDAGSAGGFVALGSNGGSAAANRCVVNGLCLDGGDVALRNTGTLTTSGVGAYGIFAESVGGGGGNGGGSTGLFSFGGAGGAGGNGGVVGVTNSGLIQTGADRAHSIFAQSVGGGGGNGGDATAIGLFLALAVGGSGGSGGDAGAVTVDNSGSLSVSGLEANAIFAQSVGGGGGNGGSATAISAGAFVSASAAIGGSGGGGGDGAAVSVDNSGGITAAGDFSDAVFAQSVGGGGGNGGAAYALSFAGGPNFAAAVSVAVGGQGGEGGDGGDVRVSNSGTIRTLDWNARGVFAQSVGGGGGDGGSSTAQALAASDKAAVAISVAVGGSGGGGGLGGGLSIENDGLIATYGDGSHAVFGQSVGGGGGTAGDASATSMTFQARGSAEVGISVGGSGGDGGDGGAVSVANAGSITTLGHLARGVTAQSIGGGGGSADAGGMQDLVEDFDLPTEIPEFEDGDSNKDLKTRAREKWESLRAEARALADDPAAYGKKQARQQIANLKQELTSRPGSVGLSIGVGGSGGTGGDGGAATLDNRGEIVTAGFMSFGAFAQSVGGGGGAGGGGDGSGSGDINIGGGFGGAGGAAGDGGAVTLTSSGAITTFGDIGFGILAQSVGGGGGVGGAGGGESEGLRSLSLSIGGGGGSSGDGGAVRVEQTGDVVTFGDVAIGVLAQSIGGGGGVGGTANASNYNNISVGGSGSAGGDGDDVTVTVKGAIATSGRAAHGVFAQSVGGGGGLASGVEAATLAFSAPFGVAEIDTGIPFSARSIGAGGGGGAGGDGGDIRIATSGDISTTGRAAHGLFAQSVGGGGGVGGSGGGVFPAAIAVSGSNGDDGAAGAITIDHAGAITAHGAGSHGILAQSVGGAGAGGRGGDIAVTVRGAVRGGSFGGAGVFIGGGGRNTVTNLGGVIGSASNLAILGTDGDDYIVNRGVIRGSVGLGGGANSLVNHTDGLLEAGAAISLGAGGRLTNAGVLSPFGAGQAGLTVVNGDLTQTAEGRLLLDVSLAGGASDSLRVLGGADMAGKIVLTPHKVGASNAGAFVTVLTADSLTDRGVGVDDTLVIDYAVRRAGNTLQVGVQSVDFDFGADFTPNQSAIAQNLNAVFQAGGAAGLQDLLDYLTGLNDAGAYTALLGQLDPAAAAAQSTGLLFASSSFVNAMMSCPGPNGAVDALDEHSCVWMRLTGASGEQEARAGTAPFSSDSTRIQIGGQSALSPGWFAGYSVGYEESVVKTPGLARSEGQRLALGAALKRQAGPWRFAGGVNFAYGWSDLSRIIGFPAPGTVAESAPSQHLAGARLRAAYVAQADTGAYLRPALDLDLVYAYADEFAETGAGGLGLIVEDSSAVIASASPTVEAGMVHVTGGGSLRPYVLAGASFYSKDEWRVPARFAGAPAGTPGFTVTQGTPQVVGRAGAGLEANFDAWSLRLEYEAKAGDDYEEHAGGLKFTARF